jgi:hypothetical protein
MADDQLSELSLRIISRTRNLIEEARSRNIVLRVLGGIAVLIHSHGRIDPRLVREVRDADLVVEKRKAAQLAKMFHDLGYDENRRFNLLNGRERLIYFDPENKTQLDVFVGEFSMCHRLPLGPRLTQDAHTLPLAEVLLTKLQIVQLNEKDLKDVLLVFHQHDVLPDADGELINSSAMASACAADWGLYKTVTDNLGGVRERLPGVGLAAPEAAMIQKRIQAVGDAIEQRPKSAAWRLRALVGTKVRWYELPEEVTGAIEM